MELALFDLDNPDEAPSSGNVSVSRLTGARLARSILASAMELRYAPPDRMARQVRFAARVAEALPVYQLLYPRSFGVMDRVAEEIFRLARP